MDITLYNCSTEPNRLDKSSFLTSVLAVTNAAANTELGIEKPVLIIESTADLSNVNYAYIADFGRYYNVRQGSAPVNNMWRFDCDVDVLMTYKNEIGALKGVVSRNKDNYDMYLKDDRIPVSARKSLTIKKFPSTPYHTGGQDGTEHTIVTMLVLGGGEA